jgi:transketolase
MTSTAPRKKLTTSAMIASFADPGQRTTSAPFGHALNRLAEERPEIVGLSADLAKYTDMHVFRDAHPDRFFQMGMAEQTLLGAAAGMAEVGLVPFASTYSVFATRRAYDFLCLDIAEPGLNVNVVGALPGLTTGYGPSHQATEDLAILRGCPNLTIVDPCDSVDIEQAVGSSPPTTARPTCGCCAARCPPCSTSTTTASSWAGPPSCAPAGTSSSSPPG